MSEHFGMKNYMKGAAILTIAAILVKILSAVYRVPFQNMVGDEGFYIYQQVYPFIAVFIVWTTSGVAVSVSKLLVDVDVEGSYFKRPYIIKVVFVFLTVLSILFFVALYGGANMLAHLMGDSELAPILRTGAFIVLIMPALAIMKGSFQSRGQLQPIAYAQVAEQFIRVCIILAGTWIIMSTTKSLYAAGHMAIFGTVLAEFLAFVLLFMYFKRSGNELLKGSYRGSAWSIVKEVTLLSLSISMSSLLLLSYQLVDSFTIYSLIIEHGMNATEAKSIKGIYDRGQPLVQLGTVIASSLALAIVPLVAHTSKKQKGVNATPFIQLTYRTSVLFGTAASLGLVLVMPFVNQMLFETDSLTEVLMLYVVQIVPLSIVLTFTAILQGYGKLKIPALLLGVGFIFKFIGNIVLLDKLGIIGAAIASDIGLLFTAIGLVVYLKKLIHIKLATFDFYMKLLFSSIAMTIAVIVWDSVAKLILGEVLNRMESVAVGGTAVALGAFVLLTLVAKTRLLQEKEWFLLPFGRRMAAYQLWLNRKSRWNR